MTTPRDLLIVATDMASTRPVEPGNMSLALAGAELIDLLGAEAIGLDGDRIVPAHAPAMADPLLDEAVSQLAREAPYESVGDWLWRRGRGLSAAYLTVLEGEGQFTRQPRRPWGLFRTGRTVLVDSPARRRATNRWASDDPILAALAAALRIRDERTGDFPGVDDDAVSTVLAAVNDALTELEAERQRRSIEKAAFDNIWRGE
ncbi:GPP34 family phosphoprotein [Streptomyces sp. NBC_01142]|uniref:GOLPH3/VPS74 family protein n=1 Tax=Streptomyces sp. NBC_01142 TaxID=2975865 RepID=UPI00224D900B|nr:GPP34 family phosphoprotein [Streptomyces sp. NBC_01142]MCX4822575.1 GPP34 family phosphoprotein [Streptomyces sp. NBC_01142]